MKGPHKVALLGAALALYSATASAQLTNQGMLDQVVMEFATRATAWQTVVMQAATFLFWTLGTISLAITFGFMALRKADIGEFFAEFIRFILFFGFFLWLLRNGPAFANSIIQSLARIGEQASGIASVTPSGIVDVGFLIWKQAIDNLSAWSPIDSFIGVILSAGILLLLAVIAVNMLLLLVSAWLLAYAGVFFLGFGGARWTSDMAVNYYKTVLGVAVQIMTMVLLVGIGNDLLSSFYARMNTGTLNFEELGVMLVFCLALLLLVNRVPPLIAGITTGAGAGGAGGIGSFGAGTAAGAALSAASMAAGAASMAGAAVMNGATSAAGGASAIKAAFEKAGASAGNDMGDMLPSRGGNGDADAGSFAQAAGFGGGGSNAGTSTPLAQAAGFANRGGEAGAPRHDGSRQDAFGRHASSTQAPGADSPPSRVGTGRVLGAAMATLGQGVSDVAKAKAAGIQHLAAERIADTAGGKVAAAIRAGASKGQTADVESPAILEDDAPTGSASASSNAKEEVAAFRDRSHGPAET